MKTEPHQPAKPLRIAILGAGKMGQHHARAIARLPRMSEVVAVFDPVRANAVALANMISGARAFDDLDLLFRSEHVDVSHVCAPPAVHEELAIRALDAGSHIYVEKPFATTRSSATRVLDRARSVGLSVCAGHQLLFESPAQGLLNFLPALDDVVHIESFFSFRQVRRAPGGRTPLRADLQLLDILPHPVYLLLRALDAATSHGPTSLAGVQIGRGGSVHALVRRGGVVGSLTVTLEGRPVESYLKVVGSNGLVQADFVRGTVQRLIGPGVSTIDKILNPLRLGRQLLAGTAAAVGKRIVRRQRSYPGLAEIFQAFYESVLRQTESPVSRASILDTVSICEQIAQALTATARTVETEQTQRIATQVLVTGGTGFLGRATVERLIDVGCRVRVGARRAPAPWERVSGVEYRVVDLAGDSLSSLVSDVDVVIHCAAETAGGWAEHQRNSLDATLALLRASSDAGVGSFLHVSSLAVLRGDAAEPVDETTPLESASRGRGPYVWGKLESEREAVALGKELGIEVKIVRPGAIIDDFHFAPPGRLGKRIGNIFVAVGSPSDRLGTVELSFAARVLAWMALHFEQVPSVIHLLSPNQTTRRELVARLRASNPDISIIWLPRVVLIPLAWLAILLQKVRHPGRGAMNVARVFAAQRCATQRITTLVPDIDAFFESGAVSLPVGSATSAMSPRREMAPTG